MDLIYSFGLVAWISLGVAFLTFISGIVAIFSMERSWVKFFLLVVAFVIFGSSIFMAYWSEKDRRENDKTIADLQEKSIETVFVMQNISEKPLPEGKYEVGFDLVPIGKNIVSIFSLQCNSLNGARINNITIKGENLPSLTDYGVSEDYTARSIVVRNFKPELLKVKVLTGKKPKIFCWWEPRQEQENGIIIIKNEENNSKTSPRAR